MSKIWLKLLQAILPTLVEHLASWLEELAQMDCPPPVAKLGRPPKTKPATQDPAVKPLNI